ncbi:MAG: hypothetical protein ATN35_07510 [Epulopiscium sp. Nele67-Bin004]|nr:MAG: hypothetical protein ATN35_07510 [Epulopiscium sp. Nele67-Bin004]
MVRYTILTNSYQNELTDALKTQSSGILKRKWRCIEGEDCYEISYSASSREIEVLTEIMASAVADIVQKQTLRLFIDKYCKARQDLSPTQKQEIADMFVNNNYIPKQDGISSIAHYLLYIPILEFLEDSVTINVDGWISFRTDKYRFILNEVVEQFIYDYETKEDYVKFLEFLREVSSSGESLEETIDLFCTKQGDIEVYRKGKPATKDYVARYCGEFDTSDMLKEDLVMHILITTCPKNIVIHNAYDFYNPNFIITLQEIFVDQVRMCQGCEVCQ